MTAAQNYFDRVSPNNRRIVFDRLHQLQSNDFMYLPRTVDEVVFWHCTSEEWENIGRILLDFKNMAALEMHNCNAGD